MPSEMTTDDFTLKLAEHIQSIWFTLLDPEVQANFKDMLGVDPDAVVSAIDPPALDMEEVATIASYIVDDEELLDGYGYGDDDFNQDLLEKALMVGLFIHGYQHRNDPL